MENAVTWDNQIKNSKKTNNSDKIFKLLKNSKIPQYFKD